MRLVYLGTPEVAVRPLRALVAAGHDVALVVTGPDRRRGRGGARTPSPVKAAAIELGLEVAHEVDEVVSVGAELGVVVAFGQLIRPHILDSVPMVNLHFSLLPRWRGAAPVERALLAGDERTGVAVMEVAEGLDTGGIYAQAEIQIGARTTAVELRQRLVEVGAELLVATLDRGLGVPQPQQGAPVYAHKLDADDYRIDWDRRAEEVDRLVRVGNAWTTFRGQRIKILAADLIDGELVPTLVQPAGKASMTYDAWRHGAQPTPDECFE